MIRNVGNALGLEAEGVLVVCHCLHQRVFTPREALRLFGAEALFDDVAKRTRCSKCGKRPRLARARWKMRARGSSWPQEVVPKDWGRLP